MGCLVESFPKHVFCKYRGLQRLIRNFLWSRKVEGHVRSKVNWDVITLPQYKGGVGIIDLVDET